MRIRLETVEWELDMGVYNTSCQVTQQVKEIPTVCSVFICVFYTCISQEKENTAPGSLARQTFTRGERVW